jgi:hypothetical protein
MGLHGQLEGKLYILYVDIFPTSHEMHYLYPRPFTGPFYFENLDDVRTSQETHLRAKNGVFCDVTPCGSCKNRRFGGTWPLLHQGDKNR